MKTQRNDIPVAVFALFTVLLTTFSTWANADMCEPNWHSSNRYAPGSKVSFLEVNYRANVGTEAQVPSSNAGEKLSGKPWTKVGYCGERAKREAARAKLKPTVMVAGH